MRAIQYIESGGPDVLQLNEVPTPEPGPGEVRLRVVRSGVNPTDWKSRQGTTATHPGWAQTPNHDGSGVVDAVGDGVGAGLVGLRAWVWEAAYQRPHGTAAEFSVVPVTHLDTLPDSADFDLGASLGVPFVTAHRCLTVAEDGPRRLGPGALAGRTVLVTGGAGAVGNAAIQLARWSDATVITTVSSPRKANLAAAAGADHVVNYREQDVAAEVLRIAPKGIDAVVEVDAAANAEVTAKVLAPNAAVAIYAGTPDAALTLPVRASMTTNARWQFVLLYTAPAAAKGQALQDISEAMLTGSIGVGEARGLPLHHFPLEETAEAHRAVEGGAVGKVLVDVG